MDRILELATRLRELASRDSQLKIFGAASGHGYRLNAVMKPAELTAFETEYAVQLPSDYRDFLLRIGNGGAGPYYGLYSLQAAVSEQPHHKSRAFLAAPFPHTAACNPWSEMDEDDDDLDDRYMCGSIVLAHQGCGYYDRLVITGPQRGKVWADGRGSGQGLKPLDCDFYGWYHNWLVDSLAELDG